MAKKLKTKVSNLGAPERNDMEFTSKWKVPSKATKTGAADDVRFDGQDMLWVFDAKPKTKGIKKGNGDIVARDNTNKDTQKTDTERLDRKQFHPYKNKPVLLLAEFWVRGYNVKNGKRHYGPWKHKQLKLKPPAAPSVSISYDSATGRATGHYSADDPKKGAQERHDTQVWMATGGTKRQTGQAYTDTSKNFTYEVPDAKTLGIGKFRKVAFNARNRGLAGDSATVKANPLYVCNPNPPTLGKINIVFKSKGVYETADVRVQIKSAGVVKDGKTAIYPQSIRLERLKNSNSATDAAGAAASDAWQPVDTDNGRTSGMTDTWGAAVSDDGKHTWYRAVAIRDGYETNGMPVCATELDRLGSSTVIGAAHIDSLDAGADGKSALVAVSGKGADDTGYEISWSDSMDAWESTEPPNTFETTGSSLVIKGLKEGVRYYVQARAYELSIDGDFMYGDYSGISDVLPVTTPSTVALDGVGTTARGQALQLSWTYDTEAEQTAWRLVDDEGKVVKSGDSAECATAILPSEYGNAASLTFHVEMTTGGGWASSPQKAFYIADPPTCGLTVAETLTAQPLSFTVTSDIGDSVDVVVTALGSTGSGLDGDPDQVAGDTVHAATYTPEWTTSNNVRSATITLPTGLALWDGASYRVDVTATDEPTGLESPRASAEFAVAWARQAMQPTVTVTRDADNRTATITVDAPSNYAMGDRFDLYRVTPDGERLIARGLPYGTAVTDRHAPYTHDGSGLSYFAATRTADGDVCVSEDAPYTLACKSLRLDWGERSIELPYNIAVDDSFEKDAELRKHMDGTTQPYWNEGVSRKASLSTQLIRFEDSEQQELLRDMLQHPGSVFVRTPDGLAFSADVQPGQIERSWESGAVSVSLDAYEHALGDDGRPGEKDIVRPAWSGGAVEIHDGTVYDTPGQWPLDDWQAIGTASGTTYVCDGEGTVRTTAGTEQVDWTWDGEVLLDANGDPVEVS